MPDMFGILLEDVYWNWQQNGKIPSVVIRREVTLLRKNADNGDVQGNFRPISLLNTVQYFGLSVIEKVGVFLW